MIKLPERNTPRWLIFLIDMFICVLSLDISYAIRFDFVADSTLFLEKEWSQLEWAFPIFLLVRASSFYFAKTYRGIIRYTSSEDAKRLFFTVAFGSLVFALISPVRYHLVDDFYFLPRPIIILDFLITLFLMLASRFMIKLLYLESRKKGKLKRNVIIYGSGELGLILRRALEQDHKHKNVVFAYVDDDPKKVGKRIEGINIQSTSELPNILSKNEIDSLIIGVLKPDISNKKSVVDICLDYGVETLSIPPIESWVNGELKAGQIRKVKIEDLLGRKEIKLSKDKISAELKGKRVLVTGAAGSIGSEIVRQVLKFIPDQVIMLDQAESPLYDVHNGIQSHRDLVTPVLGDVANEHRMKNLFSTFQPQIVYHAAAYKHVPMMEDNPSEAVLTNVRGTKILADLADQFQVSKFVMVSTDKAVNPTNVMGASKRIAEIYCQSFNSRSNTQFVTTRFGNVLGSNGSVIPLFERQIREGGPVTVTHEKVTRFFMTIPEACQLVLEAGSMGEGGEVFVFDMGESIKIIDLARKMISLSGLKLGEDIEIEITGLRPGEKLYEELLAAEENTLPTHHPQILIGRVKEYDFEEIEEHIKALIDSFDAQENTDIVGQMKRIVPEFISKNSDYSKLD